MAEKPGPVIVTGANSGFGLGALLRFAGRGWEAWGTVRSDEKADVVRDAAAREGVAERVRPVVLDVSDHDSVVDAWKDLPDFYGVVNNAGYSEMGAVEEVSASQAKAQLDVNLVAPAVVSAQALPGMRRIGAGRIVMVSSIAGRAAILPLNAWYHASKFGLEALSDVLRVEVASFGVKVSIVEPGFFKTAITDKPKAKMGELTAATSPYAKAYQRTAQMFDMVTRYSPPADIVARTIVSSVESRRPLRRYLVGADALAVATTQAFTPRAFTDAAMRFIADLRGRG